jgi:hypothetical protein
MIGNGEVRGGRKCVKIKEILVQGADPPEQGHGRHRYNPRFFHTMNFHLIVREK